MPGRSREKSGGNNGLGLSVGLMGSEAGGGEREGARVQKGEEKDRCVVGSMAGRGYSDGEANLKAWKRVFAMRACERARGTS